MPKLSATLSKKVPMPGLEYSSQQFSCSLEFELPGDLSQDMIRQKIHNLYTLLHTAIDEEIQNAIANPPTFMHSLQSASRSDTPAETRRWNNHSSGDNRQPRWSKPSGGSRYGNGNQSGGRATQAQVKAIFAISKANGLERGDLLEMLDERFGVNQPEQLSVKQASKLIETMKENGVRE
jgi:hypothetical protein